MNARTLFASAAIVAACTALPARAVDPQLLNLVMPDAKVIAGVNVDQAKTTPFGQYVLQQLQAQQPQQHLQELAAKTGFDPTRDVSELLMAASGVPDASGKPHRGLIVARGTFDTATIAAAAKAAGALTETYAGVTIIEDPKAQGGFAFLNSAYVVAGDLAELKAALDRRSAPTTLSAALMTEIGQWSGSQDAWVISAVPPSTLHPPANTPQIPGLGPDSGNAFQNIQQAAAGVKFGANAVATAQAQAATPQDAVTMSNVLQLLVNLARTQASQNAQTAALLQGLAISTSGNMLNVTVTLPQDALQGLMNHARTAQQPRQRVRRM